MSLSSLSEEFAVLQLEVKSSKLSKANKIFVLLVFNLFSFNLGVQLKKPTSILPNLR